MRWLSLQKVSESEYLPFHVRRCPDRRPVTEFIYEAGRRIGRIDVGPLGETILLRVSASDIVLLDYHTGETLGELSRPGNPILDAQYSPDGRYIAVKAGREITLHDPVTLAQCQQLVHPLFVNWYRFSPDGKRLVAGQVNEILTMWDVDTAQPLWMRQGYAGEDTVFSRDGTRFISRVRFDPPSFGTPSTGN
jgi:WD40 repeat protein